MPSNVSRKFEKVEKTILHLQTTIDEKDKENDKLEYRFNEFEVRIGKLNVEKQGLVQEKLDVLAKFEAKDAEILELEKKIEDLKMTNK